MTESQQKQENTKLKNTHEFEEVVVNGYKILYKVSYVAGARRRIKTVAKYPMWRQ